MDLISDSGTLASHTTVGGPVFEQHLSPSNAPCQTGSRGTILLQLLEFKTHLLEAVEELQIRRDAETRFEDHNSKLVLENQQLEWDKESLQHQIETVTNQHTESLIIVKKQLQSKIRSSEEEKGKYQVSAELKDKEINNLKEELKSLQLLKYNLEKKSSDLEQKLSLQSRSKDCYLNQLGEVEKRFSDLSRQCAMVKQAHEKLEQNVDEAMKIQKKLTAANEKQEATIVSLKKELEEARKKLIKTKMSSLKYDKTPSPPGREQHLQQKLHMETEMNKKLQEENVTVRAEKQEVMKSLQQTQQLLFSQTQTVNRVELELQALREHNQALKQEHRVMEDEVARLMESYSAAKNSWDKEIRDSRHSLSVSAEGTVNEAISSSELILASTQTNNPDYLEDTGSGTKIATTGAAGDSTVSGPGYRSVDGSADSMSKEKRDEGNGGTSEKEQGWRDDVKPVQNTREEGEGNDEQQWAGEDVREKRGALMVQTADCKGLTEDVQDSKQPGTKTTEGAEDRGNTGTQTLVQTSTEEVTDFMDTEPSLAACDSSLSLCQTVRENEAEPCHVSTGDEMPSDEHQRISHGPLSVSVITELQPLLLDKLQTFAESLSPSIPSELCVYQTSCAQSAAQSELETTTQPPDITMDMKQADEDCLLVRRTTAEPQTFPQGEDLPQQTDGVDDDDDTSKKREEQCVACITMDTVDPESQVASSLQHVTNEHIEDDERDASAETGSTRCCDPSPASQLLLYDDANELSLPSNNTHRSSSDRVQRKTLSYTTTHLVQGSSLSGPDGLLRRPPSTVPMFLKSQQHKVSVVITRASDLLNVSSVSGTAALSRRGQRVPADLVSYRPSPKESRASLSMTSIPVSTWQPPPGRCSRAPPSAAGPSSESHWEPSSSKEKEDQQSSFRANIYKIQEFLNSERLRLPKRQRTDN